MDASQQSISPYPTAATPMAMQVDVLEDQQRKRQELVLAIKTLLADMTFKG